MTSFVYKFSVTALNMDGLFEAAANKIKIINGEEFDFKKQANYELVVEHDDLSFSSSITYRGTFTVRLKHNVSE